MNLRLLFLFVIACSVAKAQDPQFSQFYQAPLYLNPGFTGITQQQRFALSHRLQWPNLPQTFATYAASYDIFVPELRSGFGFMATTDKMGSAGWRTTTAGLLYSYKIKLNEKIVFSPGLYFGYGINGLDRTRLSMGDGLEFDGQTLDPDVSRIGNQQYFDFGSGFLLYSRILWLGASFYHMNTPNLSILNSVSRLPMKSTIHGGARINLRGSSIRSSNARMSYITPSFIFRHQGPITQMDIGVNYHVDPVSVGIWYRGKPWDENFIGSINQDALIFTMGLYLKNLAIGYSYDFNISELSAASGGAHEISLVYEFSAKPISRQVKKKNRLIPCPTFNSKANFWN